jgi:prevent-host-death family protein
VRAVGIRELKARASELVREVRDHRNSIDVKHRGRVVARLVPAVPELTEAKSFDEVWAEMDRLAAEISESWPEGVSAADAIADVRREL